MRSALAHAAQKRAERRTRRGSLSTVPPSETSKDYDPELAAYAASILYRSPLPSQEGRPVYILNAAAFPDASEIDYDSLLAYVLARLPGEDELISGTEYEIIFFAGGQPEGATAEKKQGPGIGWYLQAYHVLSRATRKKLQRLYIVHPRTWVRVLIGVFGTIVSPKFRRKIIHVNTLSALALQIPLEKLLIPPSVYLHDRKLSPDIYAPYATGRRAFGVKQPLPKNITTGETRLPRVLRETTSFVLNSINVKTEGLFRIPPHSTLSSVLKEAYDRGQLYIIWKERGATFVQPGLDLALVDEVKLEDAYGVHLAASLIKQWYRDLRDPIFPESCYPMLKERYSDPEAKVTPEDLVEFLLPQSKGFSAPSTTSRQILTRHLLPLLHEVVLHEANNKMNSENLAICFSMCLLCGSDQLQDAKVSSYVKRILQAAIEMWPQLKEGMGLSTDAFYADIGTPTDSRDYEDPLEEERIPRRPISQDATVEDRESHRIALEDFEDEAKPQRAPTLPPRPRVETNISPIIPDSDPASAIPRRKPAPPVIDPPRYSHVFDTDGNSIHVADSPASYAPVDGFGPSRRADFSLDEDMKKGFSDFPEPTDPPPALSVPKRKAVSGEQNPDHFSSTPSANSAGLTGASDNASLARMAAERATSNMVQQRASIATSPTETVQSPETVLSEGDGVFRKPSWPASARPQQSLAKPILPQRQAQTVPLISQPVNGNNLTASTYPRPRTPSPGLLKRMSSIEVSNEASSSTTRPSLEPNRLNLKKSSVDDLRRLYEERVNTVQGLARADAVRRTSTTS